MRMTPMCFQQCPHKAAVRLFPLQITSLTHGAQNHFIGRVLPIICSRFITHILSVLGNLVATKSSRLNKAN